MLTGCYRYGYFIALFKVIGLSTGSIGMSIINFACIKLKSQDGKADENNYKLVSKQNRTDNIIQNDLEPNVVTI